MLNAKRFALKDILPNPYRDLLTFPVRPEKIDALIESYNTTGFWENIEGRVTPQGKLEIAYGHNRLAALRSSFSPGTEFDFIVRDLSDSDMIQRMSRENDESYAADVRGVLESVKTVVEAYAAGKIVLPKLDTKTSLKYIRYAPSFLPGGAKTLYPYTITGIATYLGKVYPTKNHGINLAPSVPAAFGLLENRELGLKGWTEKDPSVLNSLRNKDGSIPVVRLQEALRLSRDKKYGAGAEEFVTKKVKEHKGVCPGCLESFTKPCLDHNHKTGSWRGVLCDSCNKALGFVQDSPATLRRLAKYLEEAR